VDYVPPQHVSTEGPAAGGEVGADGPAATDQREPRGGAAGSQVLHHLLAGTGQLLPGQHAPAHDAPGAADVAPVHASFVPGQAAASDAALHPMHAARDPGMAHIQRAPGPGPEQQLQVPHQQLAQQLVPAAAGAGPAAVDGTPCDGPAVPAAGPGQQPQVPHQQDRQLVPAAAGTRPAAVGGTTVLSADAEQAGTHQHQAGDPYGVSAALGAPTAAPAGASADVGSSEPDATSAAAPAAGQQAHAGSPSRALASPFTGPITPPGAGTASRSPPSGRSPPYASPRPYWQLQVLSTDPSSGQAYLELMPGPSQRDALSTQLQNQQQHVPSPAHSAASHAGTPSKPWRRDVEAEQLAEQLPKLEVVSSHLLLQAHAAAAPGQQQQALQAATIPSALEDIDRLRVARWGEALVAAYLEGHPQVLSGGWRVVWVNREQESGLPYDILLQAPGSTPGGPNAAPCPHPLPQAHQHASDTSALYIEVKSTVSHDKQAFEVSRNEMQVAGEMRGRYMVYRVFGAGSSSAAMCVLPDPVQLWERQVLRVCMVI